MILYPYEFECFQLYVSRIQEDINKIMESGVLRGEIDYILMADYSTVEDKIMSFTIRINRKIELPKTVFPTSVQTYTNTKGESYTEIRYIFDVDLIKGIKD